MSRIVADLPLEDRDTFAEIRDALFLKSYGALISYLCDRYRADAFHIIPAFSSKALKDEQDERIARIARNEARRETKNVLYEERFITDPKR